MWPLLFPLTLVLAAACGPAGLMTPRQATATARAGATAQPTRVVSTAPTATPAPPAVEVTPPASPATLSVWINETSEEHRQFMEGLVQDLRETSQIQVDYQMVPPRLLPELVRTAAISGTLPAIILHPAELTAGWEAQGILDAALADEVLSELGPDTFEAVGLELASTEGMPAALPSHAFKHLLVYRADWIEEQDLAPPLSYATMMEAAATFFDPEGLRSGVVIPTESNLTTTQLAFEHLALANNCQLVDQAGQIRLLDEACQQAIEFYYTLIHNYSPTGVQTDVSSARAYLSGRTGMVWSSPSLLVQIAGLDDQAPPTCSECVGGAETGYLVENSGLAANLSGLGSGPGAPLVRSTNLGITTAAGRSLALAFVRYWFDAGYEKWLAVNPERKVPWRKGTPDEAERFLDAWWSMPLAPGEPTLSDIFGAAQVDMLAAFPDSARRWGLGPEGRVLLTRLHESLAMSVLLQEMLSGYFGFEQTLELAYERMQEMVAE